MIRSDTWDKGNFLTRFYEAQENFVCDRCENGIVLKINSRNAQYAETCKDCDGKGWYTATVTYPG